VPGSPFNLRHSYDYAVIRVVPRIERGEQINAGVIVSCAAQDMLEVAISLDAARLRALDPMIDIAEVEAALAVFPLIAAGDVRGGAVAKMSRGDRFHWLVAPRSAMIQTSPVHSGIDDPRAAIGKLLARYVLPLTS
jgi:hypothetical protein